ncbi:hypothetical protein ATKI12_0006 [Kitasatospora sp. Ki12]
MAEGQSHPGDPRTVRRRAAGLPVHRPGRPAPRHGTGAVRGVPVFASALDDVLARFDAPVREVMWGEDPDALNQNRHRPARLFAFETASTDSSNHSAYARLPRRTLPRRDHRAHASGILTLDDACTLVSARARLMQSLPTGGAMAACAPPKTKSSAARRGRDDRGRQLG